MNLMKQLLIAKRVHELMGTIHPNAKQKMVKCLCCGREFLSIHLRTCDECRPKNANMGWRHGVVYRPQN